MTKWRMRVLTTLLAAFVVASGLWVKAQIADIRPLPSLLPSGALLYLEAKDFRRLLSDWNGSAEKRSWLASQNFQELSLSRLMQRLEQASGEFETVAGVPIGMSFTGQVAGARSGFACYDFSAVKFVYLTQMGQSSVESTDLWRQRAGYQAREAAGVPFYVKSDAKSGRKVAFAANRGWFVVATDEDRMAQTLALLAEAKTPSLSNDEWFRTAAALRNEPGDLRLVYDMQALLRTPQYRTYWLQRNATEMKPFAGGVADLFERPDGFVEERALLRKSEAAVPAPNTGGALHDVAAYAPAAGAGLMRAWNSPAPDRIATVLEQVVTGEKASTRSPGFEPAPEVTAEFGAVGSESDLEISIDEPPFQRPSQQPITPLLNALLAMEPKALAHLQVTSVLRDQVFVLPQSAVVLLCQKPDRAALERGLAQAGSALQTGPLDPLTLAITGQIVTLSRVPLVRAEPADRIDPGVTYLALYEHRAEWPRYRRLFGVLDQRSQVTPGLSLNTPAFFSGNVGSLGNTLSRLQRASILASDAGATVRETVRYQLARP